MVWSTIDGKMHDEHGSHPPDSKLTKMQLGRLLKQRKKAEAKRKREQQLADARKIKRSKLVDDVPDDSNNNTTNNNKEPSPETQPKENQNEDPKDKVSDGPKAADIANEDEPVKPLAKEDESADKTLVDKADTPLEKDESKGDKKDNGEDEGANTIAENAEADSTREATSPEKAEADSTREASTPSPEKQGAGKVHRPRKFLPLSKRSPPAKANVV